MRVEYDAMLNAGFVLQLDCPDIPIAGHTKELEVSIVEAMGYNRYIALHLDALNNSISGLPTDRIRMRLCWGNYAGPHTADLPLEAPIGQVFSARCRRRVEPYRGLHALQRLERSGSPEARG